MSSRNSGVSIRSSSSSVSSTSALESGDPGSNPWVGINLFQNLASKIEGKSGSFECKQPKVGKSYTTSFLIITRPFLEVYCFCLKLDQSMKLIHFLKFLCDWHLEHSKVLIEFWNESSILFYLDLGLRKVVKTQQTILR